MIWGEWAQPGGSSDSEDADWGHICECIQLRVWWKLGYPRWSPLLQGSLQMASNHAMSWPGLHSMRAGPPNWEAKDASPCKARVLKSIAFSGSKQITEQGQIHLDGKNNKEYWTKSVCLNQLQIQILRPCLQLFWLHWSEVGPEPQYLS